MINQSIQLSFRQVRGLVEHSLLLFKEMDQQLANRGYEPVLGDQVQTEHGLNIHQTKDSAETLVPHFLSRPYIRKNEKTHDHALIVSVQFTHPLHDAFDPVVLGADIRLKPKVNARKVLESKPWLVKYAAFESPVAKDFKPNGERFSTKPIEEVESMDVFAHPLVDMRNVEDVTALAEELIARHIQEK
ncbi:hypothetical protein [Exiguobacterium flavidum]|uniref:hypothetical protein n=1 Tax=Exiguobacterium flavidum TaxID=2184695 RepID=UPI000DF7F38A|nr:hypothetical protein [Exiguobacterium flavidum]